jgi:CBS domain-containing protein
MRVAELMEKNVLTVGGEATVADVIVTMSDAHVSSLPVVDGQGRMLGVVSSTDVLNAEAETDEGGLKTLLGRTTVAMIMTTRSLGVSPETSVREAAQQMLYADVHRLYVVKHDRVVGVISTTDIVRAVATGQL